MHRYLTLGDPSAQPFCLLEILNTFTLDFFDLFPVAQVVSKPEWYLQPYGFLKSLGKSILFLFFFLQQNLFKQTFLLVPDQIYIKNTMSALKLLQIPGVEH